MDNISLSLGFAVPMALGIAAFGSALGLGRAVGEAVSAMSRQPEAAGQLLGGQARVGPQAHVRPLPGAGPAADLTAFFRGFQTDW
ncbi:MAG TPA: ATP synthase F0 subunit C, partial [bacterium]|nr:ATP synthase F0 subunit C [bacterium]